MTGKKKGARGSMSHIKELLAILKLKKISEIIDSALTMAVTEGEIGPGDWLEGLLTAEVEAQTERRIERRIIESRLLERKLLSDFDFVFQTGVDKAQIMELASLRFMEKRHSLLIAGNSGTGKSHIAKAILLTACQQQYRCLYTTATAMLKDLMSGLCDDSLDQKLKVYVKPDVLLIDELGFDRLEQEGARNASLFFKVIDGRYTRASTIITTNVDFKELGDYLGDPVITTAIVDRMVHHSIIMSIIGPSWRAHESQLINKPKETAAKPKKATDQHPGPTP
jgi:DNA replication protein DnaC